MILRLTFLILTGQHSYVNKCGPKCILSSNTDIESVQPFTQITKLHCGTIFIVHSSSIIFTSRFRQKYPLIGKMLTLDKKQKQVVMKLSVQYL